MKALCIPGRAPRSYPMAHVAHALTGEGDIAQWTVLTFDDTFATRYAALCNTPTQSEGAGHDTDALRTHP